MKTISYNSLLKTYNSDYFRELASFGALSQETIEYMMKSGSILSFENKEIIYKYGERTNSFSIVIDGDIAFYKHCEDHDVLTRHFLTGDQVCFDLMIGLIKHNGTEVSEGKTIILEIPHNIFFDLHHKYPEQFGFFMINMSRELAREIAILEDVIGDSTGWEKRTQYGN